MDKISCKMCGSDDLTIKGNLIVCNTCGSKFTNNGNERNALEQNIDPALHSDLIFDFTVLEEQCSNIFNKWLISGAYTPDDILQKYKHLQLKKVFLPTYLFNGDYVMNWNASSGYKHEETYQEWDKYKKQYVDKKRTLTDWRPSSGTVRDDFSEMIVANPEVSPNLASFIGAAVEFVGKDGTPFDYFDITNCTLLPYVQDEYKAFDIAKSNLDEKISSQIVSQIPGDTYKDLKWSGQTQHRTCKVYYPVYLGSFEYDGKVFSYIIDGRNEKNIFGEKPVEESRINNAKNYFILFKIFAILTPIITFILILQMEEVFDDACKAGLLVGLIGMILTTISYFIGKSGINNMAVKAQIRRLAMLKILQDDTLSDVEKSKRMQDCLKDGYNIQVTQEELLKFQENNQFENERDDNKINSKILDTQQIIFALSIAATIFAPIAGFVIGIFWAAIRG